MRVKIWGTRGSIPTPSTEGLPTVKYGGNTPCIEVVTSGGDFIVIDMGTGARLLGNELMGMDSEGNVIKETGFSSGKGIVHVLLSHFHWDHIQGLPFFKPIYIKGNELKLFAGENCEENLKSQMKKPFFPVEMETTQAKKTYYNFKDGEVISIGKARINIGKLDHTDDVYGFRIEDEGKVFTYASDVEHKLDNESNLFKLAENSDVLIYDCQFTYMEYDPEIHGKDGMGKKQWGHSIIQEGIKISAKVGVKRLVSFHHSPESRDSKIDDVIKFANEYKKDYDNNLKISAAYEGMEIEI